MRRVLFATVAAAGTAQVGPAATWLPPVRRTLSPRLCGYGARDSVAVTFDDGPHPVGTPAVLDALDDLGWRGTFFVLGNQARKYAEIVTEIAARGHEVGVHGDEHRYLIARGPAGATADLGRAVDTVGDLLGQVPRWWRPPYGVLSGPALLAAARRGVRPVLWSAWGRDWRAQATPESVVADLCRRPLAGGTLLLHDSDVMSAPGSWRTTVAALPGLAAALEDAGLAPRPLSAHTRNAG